MEPHFSASESRRYAEWHHEHFNRFMELTTEYLVDQIGARSVHGIFLCGSFAIDEGSVVFGKGSPLILSDIDLVVVFESLDAFREFYPRRNELGAACERLLPDARFAGRVEIGTFVPDSMRALSPSPGVYNMKRHARVLYGEREILDPIPSYQISDVSGSEGVVLLENRMAPLCAAEIPAADSREEDLFRFLYGISKVYTDIAVAALCLTGGYIPRYRERLEYLVHNARKAGEELGIDDALLEKIERWTLFKIEPSDKSLDTGEDLRASLGIIWKESAADLLAYWKRGAALLLGIPPEEAALCAAAPLLNWRHAGSAIGYLRNWKIYLSRYPLKRRIAIAAGLGGSLTSNDPLDIIRQAGILLLERAIANDSPTHVPVPPGRFPHGGGEWRSAARETYERWSDFIFGRENG